MSDGVIPSACDGSVSDGEPLGQVLDPQTAVSVLGDLSPGGALMKASHQDTNAAGQYLRARLWGWIVCVGSLGVSRII